MSDLLYVEGGNPLHGEITVRGASEWRNDIGPARCRAPGTCSWCSAG